MKTAEEIILSKMDVADSPAGKIMFNKIIECMEEYAASRESRILSAVPSEEDACKAYNKRNELIFITESNFSTTLQSWIACYRWMKEELIKRGIAG